MNCYFVTYFVTEVGNSRSEGYCHHTELGVSEDGQTWTAPARVADAADADGMDRVRAVKAWAESYGIRCQCATHCVRSLAAAEAELAEWGLYAPKRLTGQRVTFGTLVEGVCALHHALDE